MRRIDWEEVAWARWWVASTFNFWAPFGSASHLSGKRFAAPETKSVLIWGSKYYTSHSQCITTWGLWPQHRQLASMARCDRNIAAYLTLSSTDDIAAWSDTFSLMMEGGFALENPVPTTSHPASWKAFNTWRPSRPVAPVTSTFRAMSWYSIPLDNAFTWGQAQHVQWAQYRERFHNPAWLGLLSFL